MGNSMSKNLEGGKKPNIQERMILRGLRTEGNYVSARIGTFSDFYAESLWIHTASNTKQNLSPESRGISNDSKTNGAGLRKLVSDLRFTT